MAHCFFALPPGAPGEGSKGQVSINFSYKDNFYDFFIPNLVCVLTNKIYKKSNRIFILSPGSCPRGGTCGCWGSKILVTKTISVIFFIPNLVCVLTNKIYKKSNRIFILSPGSCPRGGTCGCWGSKI